MGEKVVDHVAVFALPSGVTVLCDILVDLGESLDELASVFVVGEVQK